MKPSLALCACLLLAAAACPGRPAPPDPSPAPEALSDPQPRAMEARGAEGEEEARRQEDLRKVLDAMRDQLGEGFRFQGDFPFAVAGDMSSEALDRLVRHTILDSMEAFYRQFFRVRPDKVLKVYLFADEASYERNVLRIWKEEPCSPYGYYAPSERALVMNIGTGGGTLVHEIVHACTAVDFPRIPKWFDEGLASLFEQCSRGEEGIRGHVNWRLPILKAGVAEGRIPRLRDLMETTRFEFLGAECSLHYAQARYFCLYLQEQGVLERYYRAFRDRFDEDPSGALFAEELLGEAVEAWEPEFLAWVDTLRWRGR